jgi:very-short-patch-repair endonuclease
MLKIACEHLADQAGTGVEYEYRFHPTRKWRFDAAFPERMIAVEIDGGAFIGGRHTRGAGFKRDCEKLNAAALMGWRVFRFLPEQIGDEMICVVGLALGKRAGREFDLSSD